MHAETTPRRSARRRHVAVVVGLIAVVLALLTVWADRQANRYFVYQPGSAPRLTTSPSCRLTGSGDLRLADGSPCARLDVPASHAHLIDGRLLMVDVLVGKATPVQYVLHRLGLLGRGVQLVQAGAVLGSTPAAQLACQEAQEMLDATATAPVAALSRLGYDVHAVTHGALVTEVVPGTPAERAGIRCNDLVTAVAGRQVSTQPQLLAALTGHGPGSVVSVTLHRSGDARSRPVVLRVTLAQRPAAAGAGVRAGTGFLGVSTESDTTYTLPFDVHIDVGDIGGPSAGLALTLGLLDTLSGGSLTGGHVVAATGTIAADGTVGDVGGVAQKTVAVERAGAQLFLVPPEEYRAAMSEADGHLKIQSVRTVSQALAALARFGGHVPPAGRAAAR